MTRLYRRTKEIFSPGLHWKQRLRLIPVLGSMAAWVYSIVRLNAIRFRISQELLLLRQLQEQTRNALEQVNTRVDALEQVNTRVDALDALQIGPNLWRIDTMTQAIAVANMERDNRVSSMTRELRRVVDAANAVQTPALVARARDDAPSPIESAGTDSFYIEFEDSFRGTRDDITGRLKVYLPYFDKFIGDDTAHVVDVGCGRGEWLGLMTERGIKATGIDVNVAMVDACRESDLQAECMDAISYLRQQPEGSLAAVTGFHIIEHLPFKVLLALFDAALRALRPDGLVIFETPNPENLIVGSCNFYYDPTHLSPIVPVVAEFMARQRGFAHAEILRLHPYSDSHRLVEDSVLAKRVNELLYGPQDYAVLAWKTHAN